MKEKIKEFMKLKQCTGYKIGDGDIICNSYPENYYFIRKENSKWIYGRSHRDKEKIVKEFQTEEEALLCLVYKLYTIKKIIELKKPYVMKWSQMSNEELIKEIDNPNIYNLAKKLVVLNDDQLIYNEKYIVNNIFPERGIERFRLSELYTLKAFEQTRDELIEFGIDPLELDRYFRFENLVDL